MEEVIVIGGGLAGSEASYRLANMSFRVLLYEMRPSQYTPAHRTDKLAELVCSNTLGSLEITSGAGLLKAEMEMLNSLIVEAGRYAYVPAGTALAVDRELFSEYITRKITEHSNIRIIREEVKKVPRDRVVIIASGPLTSPSLVEDIRELVGFDYLYFYDAISPIVEADSVDFSKGFWLLATEREGMTTLTAPSQRRNTRSFMRIFLRRRR